MDHSCSSLKADVTCNKPELVLTILHFNDVYEVEARPEEPVGGAARFATALKKFQLLNPFVVFSGDCLSPSLLSTVTKGKHMVDVLNKLGVHCAVYGNHEFDFGVDHLEEQTKTMTFPWLLSNVYDRFTSETLGHGVVSTVLEWNGLKIGVMGLAEEEWLDSLGTVDKKDLDYIDYVETADHLSAELRDKGANLVIALTHMRWRNDIRLALESKGLDLILGGHDHEYGVLEVNGILIVKSGSEFRYLSKIDVVMDQDGEFEYSCEKIVIMKDLQEDAEIKNIIRGYTDNMRHMLGELLCHIEVPLDGRYTSVRRAECNLGNLVTNAMLEATHAEVALLNSGTLRSDRLHPAGPLTMHDLLQILPIRDPVLVVEATGQQILEGLENGVSNYPALDGRFPQVSGIQFGFDPNGKPGHRVIAETVKIQGKSLDRDRKYRVAMKEFLTKGKDGYTMFSGCPHKQDIENAQILSTILINHFESGQIVRGMKKWRSGHRMGLIKVSCSPSVSAIQRSKLKGEEANQKPMAKQKPMANQKPKAHQKLKAHQSLKAHQKPKANQKLKANTSDQPPKQDGLSVSTQTAT
ncbi:trifunctional nucleotide phosphoesterase protein YfkN-like [Esox lucius]|uniref:trifunctional nucleotide phosphoesterase protein YfkN-like n=1 Tax=Esox lucius TaxID=8010 RepID=UPI0005763E6C|nr:trifunctional nucleotide phosphoesterase protein YfkN-like [Esox lucius]